MKIKNPLVTFANWRMKRKVQRFRKLFLQLSIQYPGMIGKNEFGTVYKVQDVSYSYKYNRFAPKYTKLGRGLSIVK